MADTTTTGSSTTDHADAGGDDDGESVAGAEPAGSLDLHARAREVVERLRSAHRAGTTRPLAWRRAQLEAMNRLLTECEDELCDALAADLGRPRMEAYLADVRFTGREIDHALANLEEWTAEEKTKHPRELTGIRTRIIREPLGVALVIAPWNYPIQLLLGPAAAALAAGNAVVLKPSEVASATSEALARRVPQYLDTDAVAVWEGAVPETQAVLAQRFDHIFYTGNGSVGEKILRAAAAHLTPVTLELGGKSPVIVDADADIAVAAERIAYGKWLNAGQTCLAPDYVLVHRDVADELSDALSEVIRRRYGDDPRASDDFARIVNERHARRLAQLLDAGGYDRVAAGGGVDAEARYVAPTLLRGVSPSSEVMASEIFGPILAMLEVDDVEGAVDFVNERDRPLALYVFAGERDTADDVLARTSSGGACVNDCMTHALVPQLPFGGVGQSGTGAYHGRWGFETFSHRRAVLDRPTRLEMPMLYPPYKAWKEWLVRKLF